MQLLLFRFMSSYICLKSSLGPINIKYLVIIFFKIVYLCTCYQHNIKLGMPRHFIERQNRLGKVYNMVRHLSIL